MRYQKTDVELLAAFLPRSGVMGLEGHLSDDSVGAAESSLGRPELPRLLVAQPNTFPFSSSTLVPHGSARREF